MDKFCAKCGSALDSMGNCPECSKPEQAAEVIYEPEKEPAYNTIDVQQQAEYSYSQPRQNINPQSVYTPKKPSKLELTFKQLWNVIKCFFSKNTIDAVSAQYNEKLPVWAILLPFSAVLSAISMILNINSSEDSYRLISGLAIGEVGLFIIGMLISAVVSIANILGVMFYLKAFKFTTEFKSCANFTMSAYLPMMVISAFNIITGGSIGTAANSLSLLTILGNCGFAILLYAGINKIMNNKKPFWSFWLIFIGAGIAAVIGIIIIIAPVLIVQGITMASNYLYF